MTTKALGQQGFVWWFGVVEDRNDPLQIGRVRVRIFNLHGDSAATPTDSLHWSPIIIPPTNAGLAEVGQSPTGIQKGTYVFGFFMDGMEGQFPVVLGVHLGIPNGIHDVTALARGTNTISKEPVGPEPSSAYNAAYPYNKVYQSESGHVFEIDDTPNYERLHTYHRSGTYSEIDSDGRRVNKIVGDDFEIIEKNKIVYVSGNVTVVVKGDVNLTVDGNVSATIGGDLSSTTGGDVTVSAAGNIDMSSAGNISILAAGTLALAAGGSATYDIAGSMAINATGSVEISGSTVDLNP